ncbi:MAG TPA: alanine--tRNA ligase [Hyphomicrobiales bacterium]|nr:alanine--tRNA ligase [Hyphomicrobiales bacterium]
MNSAQIRQAFLEYFREQGHTVVPSSPLVPANDPTLLFTNAGMVQFKDVFLGLDRRPYVRATSSQRCVRAGGKHNDLENVGYTARHHTFFEMLGNFSFGDYFKRDAIRFAWNFLTVRLGIPADKLWVTVYQDDDEAEILWREEIGVAPERITRLGEKSNFWAMGDTGPCGPCSEIFYDHGPDVAGGPPGSPDEDGDRYIEIWNLVFMQFNRAADGTLTPLPKPSVDTGMGLERIAAVMQHVHSNYQIDLFQHLIAAAARATNTRDLELTSLKVIADHIRSCAFLVVDGVLPSNEGRGYVLRRIIRRAIRHGHHLGVKEPFFYKLVGPLCEVMGQAYPELEAVRQRVSDVLLGEEEQFSRTLEHGMAILEEAIAALGADKQLPGPTVFKLYDTYGFPLDLTADIARERGLSVDEAGFEQAMDAQRRQARAASRFEADATLDLAGIAPTEFHGYDNLHRDASIVALYQDGHRVTTLQAGQEGVVVLDHSPFYAESGGQVGDSGYLVTPEASFAVHDTRKQGAHFLHYGRLQGGTLETGAGIQARVAEAVRQATMLNHSATHLMHAALRQVLGTHVTQKGSLVHPDYLRFDFSHNKPMTREELEAVEDLVNAQILGNWAVEHEVMPIDQARTRGAMALFGEKYGDVVRVITMGERGGAADVFSIELCGGTHVNRTGDIGLFLITGESGIAAGVRRIEAVTGSGALRRVRAMQHQANEVAALFKATPANLGDKAQQFVGSHKALEKELQQLKSQLASAAGSELAGAAQDVKGVKVVARSLEGVDGKALRDTADSLRNKLGVAVVVLAGTHEGKVNLVVAVSRELNAKVKAGDLVNRLATYVGGKGGGRPDLAMAGGNDPTGVPAALEAVLPTLQALL